MVNRPSDTEFTYWEDDRFYTHTRGELFYSTDLLNYTSLGTWSRANSNGYATNAIRVKHGHMAAAINVHEYGLGVYGNAWGVDYNITPVAEKLYSYAENPTITLGDTVNVNVFATDSTYGTRTRTTGTNTITASGSNIDIVSNNIAAVDGMSQFEIIPTTTGVIEVDFTSSGLEGDFVKLFVLDSTSQASGSTYTKDTTAIDDFDLHDDAALVSANANWTRSGGYSVIYTVGNRRVRAGTPTLDDLTFYNGTFEGNQWAQVELTSILLNNRIIGPGINIQPDSSGYGFYGTEGTTRLYRIDNGVSTQRVVVSRMGIE
jgi:hypothetical protein